MRLKEYEFISCTTWKLFILRENKPYSAKIDWTPWKLKIRIYEKQGKSVVIYRFALLVLLHKCKKSLISRDFRCITWVIVECFSDIVRKRTVILFTLWIVIFFDFIKKWYYIRLEKLCAAKYNCASNLTAQQ